MVFHGIDTFGHYLRAPFREEKPALRWLAYGSSITHSSRNGYPALTARRLGVDVLNKGMSGSCFVDPTAAEFLAADCDWDIATLEMGINMRLQYSVEEFERRARHFVARCVELKPGRPVVLLTIFRNAANHLLKADETSEKQEAFNEVIRQIARDRSEENVHLIEGTDIVEDLGYLGVDLVHPTDYGHARMAEKLARALSPTVASLDRPKTVAVPSPEYSLA